MYWGGGCAEDRATPASVPRLQRYRSQDRIDGRLRSTNDPDALGRKQGGQERSCQHLPSRVSHCHPSLLRTTGRASRTRRVGRSQGRRQCPSPTWWDPGDLHAYDASIKAWVKAPFPLDMTGPGGSARTRYAEYRPGSAAIPTPRYRHLGGPHAQSAPTKAQLPRPVPPERGAHGGPNLRRERTASWSRPRALSAPTTVRRRTGIGRKAQFRPDARRPARNQNKSEPSDR